MADRTPGQVTLKLSHTFTKGRRKFTLEQFPRPKVGPSVGWIGDLWLTQELPDAVQDANAAFLALAWNTHDDLLAALEVAERFMAAWLADHSMEEWPLDKYEAIEIARAAIARAKEGV